MTPEQRERFENRKGFETVSIRSFEKNGSEVVRVSSLNQSRALVIEVWARKTSQNAVKAFKRTFLHVVPQEELRSS